LIADIKNRHKRKPSRLRSPTTVTAGFVSNIVEPGTPSDVQSNPDLDQMPSSVNHSLFHNYLRAIHPFDPSDSVPNDDDALTTTAIRPGDLILVHCIHANGWADGTVLNTSVRGWLPTNYCEAFDHPYLRNLLNAMTQFWDLIGAGEDANLSTFVRQDYIRGLIAGVRHLLERADCLHRDSTTVKLNVGVRRMRKGLLADLSTLVQIAKRLQETISEPFAGEVIPYILDDLISKAFKVVNRAVSFLDVWTQEVSAPRSEEHLFNFPKRQQPPTRLSINTQHCDRRGAYDAVDSAKHFPEQVYSSSHDKQAFACDDELREMPVRRSVVFTPPNGFAAHRMSLVSKEASSATAHPLASVQLDKVHDVCISHIGAFIGHHLHSRPASELVATTEKLVVACRNMLAIVDEVYAHDPKASSHVQQVRCDFQTNVEELAMTTKDVFRFSDSPDDEVVMLPEQTDHLISVGTSLIRNTGECVVKTRQLIEQIGDFELKSWMPTSLSAETSASEMDIPERVDSMPINSPRPLSTQPLAQHRMSVNRLSVKVLSPPTRPPPSPQDQQTHLAVADSTDVAMISPADTNASFTSSRPTSKQSMPPPPRRQSLAPSGAEAQKSTSSFQSDSTGPARKQSISGSTDTHNSARDSGATAASQASTRATTPDHAKESVTPDTTMMSSFASASSLGSLGNDSSVDAEAQLLTKTYANELTFNKEGQVTGGSLAALVEQLTAHDGAPDPQYVAAFFLTFRKFSEPREVAQTLIHRFDYVGDSKKIGAPARLRIYNIFKQWLETYWSADADKDALGEIRFFALHKLKHYLPSASERLIELTRRVTDAYHNGTALVSGVGRSSMSLSAHLSSLLPDPIITNKQLNALRVAVGGGSPCSIIDLDPVELARQITILVMKVYCDIRPQELLSMDWSNPTTKRARNVRRMCLLNTDISHIVADTILFPDSPKQRANILKHWAKIALACLELNNYDTVMSIMCTINSSVIQRLKKTWEHVSKKTRARFQDLDKIVDMSKNYTSLRRRLDNPTMSPCLPFLGVYLTDLTFVIAGNPKRREIPSAGPNGTSLSVINFDVYMRISKIIGHLQRFQTPYHLKPVPELQTWLEAHLGKMRAGHEDVTQVLHARSLAVEPKAEECMAGAVAGAGGIGLGLGLGLGGRKVSLVGMEGGHVGERPKTASGSGGARHDNAAVMMERFDFLWRGGAFGMRSQSHSSGGSGNSPVTSPTVEQSEFGRLEDAEAVGGSEIERKRE
jgi:hypothetical protein